MCTELMRNTNCFPTWRVVEGPSGKRRRRSRMPLPGGRSSASEGALSPGQSASATRDTCPARRGRRPKPPGRPPPLSPPAAIVPLSRVARPASCCRQRRPSSWSLPVRLLRCRGPQGPPSAVSGTRRRPGGTTRRGPKKAKSRKSILESRIPTKVTVPEHFVLV